jgi:hypothetical protein
MKTKIIQGDSMVSRSKTFQDSTSEYEVVDLHIWHYFDTLGMLGSWFIGSRGLRDSAGTEQGPHVALLPAPVAATGLSQRQADPLVGASLHFAMTRLNGSFVPSKDRQ